MSATALLVGWLAAGLVATAAAWLAERACAALGLPRRLPWALALAVLVARPVGAARDAMRARVAARAPLVVPARMVDDARVVASGVPAVIAPAGPTVRARLADVASVLREAGRDAAATALGAATGALDAHVVAPVGRAVGRTLGVRWTARAPLALGTLWALATLALLARLAGEARTLARLARRWRPARLADADVLLAADVGPAVVGVVRPRIVVPAWTLDLAGEDAALVVAHEREHLRARDPWLLAAALGVATLVPWHPAAWVAVRRLRLAVEADCDRRVLGAAPRSAGRVRRYGALLLDVAERTARGMSRPPRVQAAVALLDPPRALEARVRALVARPARGGARVAAVLSLGTALGGLAAACAAPAPAPRAAAAVAAAESADAAGGAGAAHDGAPDESARRDTVRPDDGTRVASADTERGTTVADGRDAPAGLQRRALAMLETNHPDTVRALVRALAPAALDGRVGRRPSVGFLFGPDGTLRATVTGDDRGAVRDAAGWRRLARRATGRPDGLPLPSIVQDAWRGPLVSAESVLDFFPGLAPAVLEQYGLSVLRAARGDTLAVVFARVRGTPSAAGDTLPRDAASRDAARGEQSAQARAAHARAEVARALRAQVAARAAASQAVGEAARTRAAQGRALEMQARALGEQQRLLGEVARDLDARRRALRERPDDAGAARRRALDDEGARLARDAAALARDAERARRDADHVIREAAQWRRDAERLLDGPAAPPAPPADAVPAEPSAGPSRAPALVRLTEVRRDWLGRGRDVLVWTTGDARVGVRGAALAARREPFRVRSVDGLTADVRGGEVHLQVAGFGAVEVDGRVTNGRTRGFGGSGRHLVLLRGGSGIQTND